MLTLLPDTPKHVVAYVLDGTATAPDVRSLYREIEAVTDAGRAHLFAEIAGVGGLTLDALRANVAEGVRLISRVGRVDRYAVVTDEGWISVLARAQGALVPGLETRVWPRAERAAALAWASAPLAPRP